MAKKLSLKDQLNRYQLRIDISRKWREQEGFDALWKRMVEMYRGKHFESLSKDDQVAVNISFATVNVIAPSIAVNHPKITVTARDAEKDDNAVVSEAVMDYWFKNKEYGIRPEIRLAVDDYLMVGHGWVKTGYRFKEKPEDLTDEEMEEEFAAAVEEMEGAAQADPEMAQHLPSDEEIWANLPTTKMVIDEDRPFAERVSFNDIFVDPESTTDRNMGWICQKIVMPIEEAKANELWDAGARKALKGHLSINSKWVDDQKRAKNNDDVMRVTIWEFYDLKKGTMCVFGDHSDLFLIKPKKMPYKFGHPFEMLRNYDVPDQFYPMGDLEAIEPLQRELNATRTQLMKTRRQFARKVFYRESALGQAGRAALESREEEWVPVLDGQWGVAEVAAPAPSNAPPPELFNYSGEIIQNVDMVTATSDYQRGGQGGEIRRTATEASMIQDAVNARSQDKLATIEDFIARIGGNLHCLARQYMTGEAVAHVAGRAGATLWVPYDQETLDFEADYEVEAGSTMPKNEQFRQNQAMNLMNALGPFVGTVVDPGAMIRFILTANGVKNPDEFLMAPPPPGAVDPATGEPIGPPPGAAPPGDPMAAPPGGAVPPAPSGADLPPELQGLDPALLAQLMGQVGLDLGV